MHQEEISGCLRIDAGVVAAPSMLTSRVVRLVLNKVVLLLTHLVALSAVAGDATVLFGTVNFNQQLADHPEQWQQTARRTDGMLLHVHYFVRGKDTLGGTYARDEVLAVGRKIAPSLAAKQNCVELTFHIRSDRTDPAAIAREHAKDIDEIERLMGIPISDVNVDWILSILDVAARQNPPHEGESTADHARRLAAAAGDTTRAYVRAFREAGRDERLHAVFPPVYVNQGRWNRRGKPVPHAGVQNTEVIARIFDAGFDGFTADSPLYLIEDKQLEAQGYHDALRAIQELCRGRGKDFGIIVNQDVDHVDQALRGDAWDAAYQAGCMEVIRRLPKMGLAPKRLIVESWYKGPFALVPETKHGTFTHTVLQVEEAIRQR